MRLCLSNGITGIRLCEGSERLTGGLGGLRAEANNVSLQTGQLCRARPSPDSIRPRRGQAAASLQLGLQPGLAELPGRQRQGRDANRLRSEGLFPESIYANERRFRSSELS